MYLPSPPPSQGLPQQRICGALYGDITSTLPAELLSEVWYQEMYRFCDLIFCLLSSSIERTEESIQNGDWVVPEIEYVLVQ